MSDLDKQTLLNQLSTPRGKVLIKIILNTAASRSLGLELTNATYLIATKWLVISSRNSKTEATCQRIST
jgi:hypothetical protein